MGGGDRHHVGHAEGGEIGQGTVDVDAVGLVHGHQERLGALAQVGQDLSIQRIQAGAAVGDQHHHVRLFDGQMHLARGEFARLGV